MPISTISGLGQPHEGNQMFKTIALFFVLGLMVSCASYHNERTISSLDQEADHQPRYERSLR
jgi:hypothetical protein